MGTRARRRVLTVLAIVAAAAGLVAVSRATAGTGAARDRGYARGYAAGVTAGHAAGLREGRAIQLTQALPTDRQQAARAAFDDGYAAGANDVFDGYDGGWGLSAPYVIVLAPAGDSITYRIASRVGLDPNTDYYLCPGSTRLCHRPR
ncbi:hypothetical protein GCM10023322_63440 [Rugosimonospora acidiphila]|uniref:Uncharacterized protein n=1 Tax=Rugosimonospora acidiphila TaxID=556531 RepID=A0ABP9SJQ3_9ACTN